MIALFTAVASAQHIYKWKDNKGQWHFSDKPPAEVRAEQVKGLDIGPVPPLPPQYTEPPLPPKGSESREKAVSELPTERPTDVPPSKLTSRWLLVRAPIRQAGLDASKPLSELRYLDASKPLSEWRYWQTFDNAEACKIERLTEIARSLRSRYSPFGTSYSNPSGGELNAIENELRCVSVSEFKPPKEANVIVESTNVGRPQSGRIRPTLLGRVFNKGLSTARNVVVRYKALNSRGVVVGRGNIRLVPSDLPGLTAAEFDAGIIGGVGVRGLRVDTEVVWSKN